MLCDYLKRPYFICYVVGEKNNTEVTGSSDPLYIMLAKLFSVLVICFKGAVIQTEYIQRRLSERVKHVKPMSHERELKKSRIFFFFLTLEIRLEERITILK